MTAALSLRSFPLVARLFTLPSMAWILAATAFINRMGVMAKLFMAIYLREALHLPVETVGVLLALYGAGTLTGAYGMGVASDHVPPRRLAVGGLVASGLGLVLLGQVESPWLLGLLLFASGAADAGYRPVVQRLIMEACTPEERPRAQSLHRVAINLGFSVGGFAGGMLAGFDYRYVFWLDAASSFAAAGWLSYALAQLAPPATPRSAAAAGAAAAGGLASPYGDRAFLLLLAAALPLGMMYDQVNGMYGPYLREHLALTPAQVGWQHGLNGLMVGLLQLPLTAWSQRFGLGRQMLWGCALMVAGLGCLPLAGGVAGVILSTAVWTLGEMLWMPSVGVLVMQRAEGRRSGHYFGLYSAMWSLSTLCSPLVASQIYARHGGDAVWWTVLAAGLPAMLLLQRAVGQMLRD
ncbi:MFS transporter [Chitinimonas koreensis]|uniref:MFS transporter n=1 Tax=Chitinimonas koreensis TaxID=356302 RepID=UPI00041F5F41|nr:MFS transporter [Chitinimonas koreensis]QNM97732.1 MFS transporter [Chitinimonas koreensis]